MINFEGKEIEILWYLNDAKNMDWNTSQDLIYEKFGSEAVQNCIIDSLIGYQQNSFILTEIGTEIIMGQMKDEGMSSDLGKNYTNPHDVDYEDDPNDWLASSLIFASSLGCLLRENEGIIIKLQGDMITLLPGTAFGKVIVWNQGGQVHVITCEEDLPHGQLIWMEPPNKEED